MATIVEQDDFVPAVGAGALKDAMDGIGTNENEIIAVLSRNNNMQRQEIKLHYKASYGEDLLEDLKRELKGDLQDVVEAMLMLPRAYDAHQLHKAMQGLGTKEQILTEIICSRTVEEMTDLNPIYEELFEEALEEHVKNETAGNFQRLLVSEMCMLRELMDDDDDRVLVDAKNIFEAGEGQLGTDESVFSEILTNRSHAHLRRVFVAYNELAGEEIEDIIRREAMGNVQDAWLALATIARGYPGFYATRLHDAIAGIGTDDDLLIRIIVSRSETDLAIVKEIYEERYGESLAEAVGSNCKGDYRQILEAIIEGNR